ncbi:MAG: ABC transporter ATP-binding protein/permease [Lachnospiraceae bacterium]|nr:ABC transporter ATP-binding protein/permease [Lachnospiraceae bacterium]
MTETKNQSVWKNFIHLIRQIRLPILLIGIAFLLNFGKAEIELLIPEKIADLTGFEFTGTGSAAVKTAVSICIMIFVLAAVEFVGVMAATYITYIAKARINRDFQAVAARKVFYLTTEEAEARDPKEFISRITTDTGFVSDFLIDLLVMEIPRLYFLISTLIKVSRMGNGMLLLGFVLVVPVIVLGSFWSGHVTYKSQTRLQNAIARLTARLAEKVEHAEIIKAYNRTEDEIADGEIFIDEMRAAQKKTTLATAFNQLVANVLFVVPTLIIMTAGALQLIAGDISTPQFVAYYGLGATYQKYIAEHLTLWVLAKKAQGATRRISGILMLKEDRGGERQTEGSGDLTFENVSFSIGGKKILSDVSFTVKIGSKFAIVGGSGAGKSTILNLLEQFYRPEQGRITLGGVDIRDFEIGGYRSLFSYLPQNAPGFDGTVRDFLCYGSGTPHSDEELKELLREVDMTESVEAMGGLDFEVGPGASKLSGGQRQRLAVARMLLTGAGTVLADEATSALDFEGSRRIASLIDKYAAGKTRIIVAHDLSTVQDADMILVLNKGRVDGMGTHTELKETCPAYRRLLTAGEEETA